MTQMCVCVSENLITTIYFEMYLMKYNSKYVTEELKI